MFGALAGLVSRYPRFVLGAWLALSLASLPFAARVGDVLTAQPEAPREGNAAIVKDLLATVFQSSEEGTLVAVAHGRGVHAGTEAYAAALDEVKARLLAIPGITYVRDYRTASGLDLLDEQHDLSVLLLGMDVAGLVEGKAVTGSVRSVLESAPSLRFDLSGGPATVIELEEVSERDARRAEVFGLPISLLILLVAFGAVVASLLPLLSAMTSIVASGFICRRRMNRLCAITMSPIHAGPMIRIFVFKGRSLAGALCRGRG